MGEKLGFHDMAHPPERLVPFDRVVVKVGSRSLFESGRPRPEVFLNTAKQIDALYRSGVQTVLVTSGAVQMGKNITGDFGPNGTSIEDKQVLAAIGQPALHELWRQYFEQVASTNGRAPLHVAQFLPTEEELHLCEPIIEKTFARGHLPVVNANDPMNDYEMRQYAAKSADNDQLALHVAVEIGAGGLVILTNEDGVLDRERRTIFSYDSRLIGPHDVSFDGKSEEGTGGMRTKLECAQQFAQEPGNLAVIANASHSEAIIQSLQGQSGPWTLFRS